MEVKANNTKNNEAEGSAAKMSTPPDPKGGFSPNKAERGESQPTRAYGPDKAMIGSTEADPIANAINGLTPHEEVLLATHAARRPGTRRGERRNPRTVIAISESKATEIELPHPDANLGWKLLMEGLGTADPDFAGRLLHQLAGVRSESDRVDGALEFLLSVIKDIKPRDQLEAMLAAQMAVAHVAMMKSAKGFMSAESLQQYQAHEGSYNRLARTFAAQLEALKRYRTGGEQKITVQHVQNNNVSVEGQAIVGNVTHMRGKSAAEQSASAAGKPAAPPPALNYAPQPRMPIIDESARTPVLARARRRRK